MKVQGNGQGKIFTPDELRLLFIEGLVTLRNRALFGICLFTGCRVSEALDLLYKNIAILGFVVALSTHKIAGFMRRQRYYKLFPNPLS